MRALQLVSDRKLELTDIPPPSAPGEGEVQVKTHAIALNHIDVWGWRGMAFAKRKMPLVVGAEACGEVVAVGKGVSNFKVGDPVTPYGAHTCGHCKACQEGRDNLCENPGGVNGFHIDGFAQDLYNHPARLTVKSPKLSWSDMACAPLTFATSVHMLFDNAKLQRGETVLVQAGGSGIGTAAIKLAKALDCTVITTVGSDEKVEKAKAIGADYAINYRKDRFEHETRKITKKKGVDVVFEHTGADTWDGSLLSMKRGGRLVTCGATSGPSGKINLMQLFQQQYKILGSFGFAIRNVAEALEYIAKGVKPVIDSEVELKEFEKGLHKLEGRDVFGKVVVRF